MVFPRALDTEAKASTGREKNTVGVKDSFVLGGRVGSWGTEVGLGWFGMAVDVSYTQSETKESFLGTKPETKILPVTVLFMFRYPGEKVQPYAGIGGGVFLSQLKSDVDLSSLGGSGGGSFKDYQVDAGFDARAGLAVKVHKKISIFVEGRYVYFSPKYKDKVNGQKVTVETDAEAIQALAGISFRF
jgi:opacity protein-like surface antigen